MDKPVLRSACLGAGPASAPAVMTIETPSPALEPTVQGAQPPAVK